VAAWNAAAGAMGGQYMKRIALILLGLGLLAPAPAMADHPDRATARDIRLLQDELENLDSLLATVPADSRSADFRDRERQIRDDVVALREEIRRHRRDNTEGFGASKQAVEDLRQRIRILGSDIDRSYASRYPSGNLSIREGTQVQVRLEEPLSSRTARMEDRVEATVELPVRDASGRIIIPAGSRVVGTVTRVQRAQRPARGGELEMMFDSLYLGSTRYDIRTRLVSVDEDLDRGDTAERAGIGAVLGGVLGGLLGGTKGALIGLVIGGTGGVASSRGEEVELPAGTILTLSLEQPLSARPVF
jgi:hypothetical protein